MRNRRFLSLLILVFLLIVAGGATRLVRGHTVEATTLHAGQSANQYVLLTYTIDRSNVPALTYEELTLVIDVGDVEDVSVNSRAHAVDYVYNPNDGTVIVTTAAQRLHVLLVNPTTTENLGKFSKAALKGNKQWAWSHALEDNTALSPAIDVLQAKGWRGTLFMSGTALAASSQQSRLKALLAHGWSLGHKVWDDCTAPQLEDPQFLRDTILQGYRRFGDVIAVSPVPTYRPLAVAAPCLNDTVQPYMQKMLASGETSLLFNESGERSLMVVDPNADPYSANGRQAEPFSFDAAVGRDASMASGVQGAATVRATMDWIAAHANSSRHFWYNTVSQAEHEDSLSAVVDILYATYGPAGSDEVWVAPSDEIYSYLLVRDHSTVTFSGPILLDLDYSVRLARDWQTSGS